MGIDVVCEGKDLFLIAVVVLQGDLEIDTFLDSLKVNHLLVKRRFVLVEMFYEGNDSAGVVEVMSLFRAFIFNGDEQALVQEGEFSKSLRKGLEDELGSFEDPGVRLEVNPRAPLIRLRRAAEVASRGASFIPLDPDLATSPDLELEPLRKCINDRHANAMESARDFVGIVIEFASGVELGEYNLGGRPSFLGHDFRGNTTAIVRDGHRTVRVDADMNFRAVSG